MGGPFQVGLHEDMWTKCIDVVLEKKRGVRQTYKFRIICLLEADFNTALKTHFAQKMIPDLELTNLTNE